MVTCIPDVVVEFVHTFLVLLHLVFLLFDLLYQLVLLARLVVVLVLVGLLFALDGVHLLQESGRPLPRLFLQPLVLQHLVASITGYTVSLDQVQKR